MMKLIRFFLSHIILLLFIAALVLAYIYRSQLFSPSVNTHINELTQKALFAVGVDHKVNGKAEADDSQQQTKTTAKAAETIEPPEAPVENETEQSAELAENESATDVVEQQASSELVVETESQAEIATESEAMQQTTETTETQQAVTSLMEQTSEDKAQPVKQEKPVEQVEQSETKAVEPAQPKTVSNDKEQTVKNNEVLLNKARLAFQMQQSEKSIELYQQLAELVPDDPNVYGELGNVFYADGQWTSAGQAYYRAASLLMKRGDLGQVHYLYRVIQQLDEKSAEKLRKELAK